MAKNEVKNEAKRSIQEIVKELQQACFDSKTPFLVCCLPQEEEEEKIIEFLTPSVLEVKTQDRTIEKMITVYRGFETVPPHEMITVECEVL